MSQGAVGARYAQALLELGEESGQLEALVAGFARFGAAYETSRELRRDLSNPTIPAAEREAALRAVASKLSVPDLGVRGLLIMAKRRRLAFVPDVARALTGLYDQKAGVLRGHVVTATVMSDDYFDGLAASIGRTVGRRVLLTHSVDEALIAGAILRIGDATVDVSVRGRLGEMQRNLLQAFARAS
jgi:F-type H+-transporting ATPase subunit delta